MSDINSARQAMAYIRTDQLRSDEDIFRLAGNCKFFGGEMEGEFLKLGDKHPKAKKFPEKWRHAKPHHCAGMIFALAKENGFQLNKRPQPIEKSFDIAIYEKLLPLNEDCRNYYIKRSLTQWPETARISTYKGETSIWVPYCANGSKVPIGMHKTFPQRTQRRKVLSKGEQPANGIYSYLGKIGESKAIHITEGVETGLAVMSAGIEGTFIACLNSTNLKKYKPMDSGPLYIWADKDKSKTGQKAATAAARANTGNRTCFIIMPNEYGKDWNDILQDEGSKAIIKAFSYAEVYFDRRTNNTGRPVIDCYSMAKAYAKSWSIGNTLALRCHQKTFYAFNGKCYREFPDLESHVMAWLQSNKENHLDEVGRLLEKAQSATLTREEKKNLEYSQKNKPATSRQAAMNLIANLDSFKLCAIPYDVKTPCFLDDNYTPAGHAISFSNGKTILLDEYLQAALSKDKQGATASIIETTPDIFQKYSVNYPLITENTDCPMWLDYLKGVQPNKQSREVLQMLMGLMLIPDTSFNVMFFLNGPSGCGKSQFLEVLKGVIGIDNICSVQPHLMVERFQTKILTERLVNVVGDLAATSEGRTWSDFEGTLKDRSDGGLISTEVKGRPDIASAPNIARDIYATNSMPYFADKSGGIWDRVRIINFEVNFRDNESVKIPDIGKKILKEESPAIFLWALKGLIKLKKLQSFPETISGIKTKEEHRETCNPDIVYFNENYIFMGNNHPIEGKIYNIKCDDLYKDYRAAMEEAGHRAKNKPNCFKLLKQVFPKIEKAKPRIKGESERAYRFIGICRRANDLENKI